MEACKAIFDEDYEDEICRTLYRMFEDHSISKKGTISISGVMLKGDYRFLVRAERGNTGGYRLSVDAVGMPADSKSFKCMQGLMERRGWSADIIETIDELWDRIIRIYHSSDVPEGKWGWRSVLGNLVEMERKTPQPLTPWSAEWSLSVNNQVQDRNSPAFKHLLYQVALHRMTQGLPGPVTSGETDAVHDPNAAMIERDGPANSGTITAAKIEVTPISKVKQSINGLLIGYSHPRD